MRIPKVVIDTNVFVSAAFLKGTSAIIMDKWSDNKFVLLFSPAIFDEYFEVIARPKFKQKEEDIRGLAELLTEKGIAVEPGINIDMIDEDPDDNKFLECAVSGDADFIVSGDKHLLSLKSYHAIKIVKVTDFVKGIS